MKYKILCVDDNPDFLLGMKTYLKDLYKITTVTNQEDSLNHLKNNNVDLILLDIDLGEHDGFEILREIKEHYPDVIVFMLSAHRDPKLIVKAMNLGAANYIIKDTDIDELRAYIDKELKNGSIQKSYNILKEKHEALVEKNNCHSLEKKYIGKSTAFNNLVGKVKKLKGVSANILIEGESGAGKEVIASMIHRQEMNSNRPFIKVNCAAIPHNLIESELFGHEKGSFTGAIKKKIGQFELANGGDIFLDEINSLQLELQAKILRVLQDKTFMRVGGTETITVDIRIIAASNASLEKLVEKGNFRQDLFYRLKVVSLFVPPLRERKEDIPELVNHFLKKHAQNGTVKKFSQNAFEILMSHSWPGNVRELAHLVQSLIIVSESDIIHSYELQSINKTSNREIKSIIRQDTPGECGNFLNFFVNGNFTPLKSVLGNVEYAYIKKALNHYHGNISKAADSLGIGRQRIYDNLKYN